MSTFVLKALKKKSKHTKKGLKPSLGVCIPVWSRPELLEICFASLIKNLDGLDATIWIFDNGSDAKTRSLISKLQSNKYRIHKVFFPVNMGIPYVANIFSGAVKESCDFTHYKAPDYVMIMDADAYFKNPVLDLITILENNRDIGIVSGHDSIEHKTISQQWVRINGKDVVLKTKAAERMITMLMSANDFCACYPFPHDSNQLVDWSLSLWNKNSMKSIGKKIAVACDYVLHLGINLSTWNNEEKDLASLQEKKEVEAVIRKENSRFYNQPDHYIDQRLAYQKKYADVFAENQQLKRRVRDIQNSTSWRITLPLRVVSGLLAKISLWWQRFFSKEPLN